MLNNNKKSCFTFRYCLCLSRGSAGPCRVSLGAVVMETYNNGTMLNGQCEAAQRGRGDFKNSTLPGMPYLCLLLTTVVMVWHFHHRRTSSEKISLKVSWFRLLLNCLSAFVHFHIFCTYVYLIIFYWFFSIFLHFYILVDRQLCIWQ